MVGMQYKDEAGPFRSVTGSNGAIDVRGLGGGGLTPTQESILALVDTYMAGVPVIDWFDPLPAGAPIQFAPLSVALAIIGSNMMLIQGIDPADPIALNLQAQLFVDWGEGAGYEEVLGIDASGGELVGEHEYAMAGTYTINVRVTNAYGNSNVLSYEIEVTA